MSTRVHRVIHEKKLRSLVSVVLLVIIGPATHFRLQRLVRRASVRSARVTLPNVARLLTLSHGDDGILLHFCGRYQHIHTGSALLR